MFVRLEGLCAMSRRSSTIRRILGVRQQPSSISKLVTWKRMRKRLNCNVSREGFQFVIMTSIIKKIIQYFSLYTVTTHVNEGFRNYPDFNFSQGLLQTSLKNHTPHTSLMYTHS